MKKSVKRTIAALAAASGIAAGSVAAATPAHAAAGPGDLALFGGVNCYFKGWGPTWDNLPGWRMHRWMGVKNIGGSTMTNVNVTEFGGPTKLATVDKKRPGVLRAGEFYMASETTWRGCFPSSISGYTISAQVENIFNNAGFWWNLKQFEGDQKQVPNTQKVAPSNTNVGNQAPPAAAVKAAQN
ncbi:MULTISPECIES: hypothetical protein [Gordonia]|uniref:hypothetical protein n=1 Tax=Gordonia TaxID=2053 RepID=UPI0007E9A12A|nr:MULTISPECIES: hypothetical protein [Gordonia]MCM3895399.1 hypothetical protein [Gordonia sputi]OBA67325.1 hypothetical protein A5777_17295 [Gordonia sp. 852002-10350_SCH5691597]